MVKICGRKIYDHIFAGVLIGCFAVYLYARYQSDQLHVIFGGQNIENMRPAGELIENVRLIQQVNIQQIQQVDRQLAQMPLCIEILMANYSNRSNNGTIRLGVALNDYTENTTISVDAIQDNAYHQVCFANISLTDVYAAQNLQILLEGVDSTPGHAVTAWLTQDVSLGKLNPTNSNLTGRSLLFHLGYVTKSPTRTRNALVLAFLTFIAMYILIVQTRRQSDSIPSLCDSQRVA
ncbi:MAG: hypothetical protein PHI97_21485 [Desulfobulbus sp.]|nr:hypothetical protein [Desulfobulbus sp.]